MKYVFYLFSFLLISCQTTTTEEIKLATEATYDKDVAAIKKVMSDQEKAWNNHDLEGFMEGYWNSDNLKFYGSNGLTNGWENTLDNYKKAYPTSAESGILRFVINDISRIEAGHYWVMGEYHLTRDIGNANGVFMIIFKKIDNQWKIIADMSC
ncbi:MAG: nuclear transport factor 2 family protein [Algicola sp.]|nr:nuclear transport factor 2 family protein [Algicola sp.]